MIGSGRKAGPADPDFGPLPKGPVSLDQCEVEAPKRAAPGMDPVLRLIAKLDRMMSEIPEGARIWALAYLQTKYGPKTDESRQ